jgi:hypothetical protein
MRLFTLLVLLGSGLSQAQDACETRCNQLASECLKTCAGENKETNKPAQGAKLLACLKACEEKAGPCRAECKKPAPK